MNVEKATRGSFIERKAWILLALMGTVMVLFGLMAFFTDPAQQAKVAISGSKCCNGKVLDQGADPWVIDYVAELAKYMGTFMVGAGVFALALIIVPFRRGERWAWITLWYLPALFTIHGFALGSFPFDIVPLTFVTLGLLIPARQFWGEARRKGSDPAFVAA